MAKPILMPKQGITVESCVLTKWNVKVGDTVKVAVEPCIVKATNPLSSVNYEFNAVYYHCDRNDTLGFYGKGAGRFPTASAIVSDVLRVTYGGEKYYFNNENAYKVENFLDSDYYVYKNGVGSIVSGIDSAENYDFVARLFNVED